MGGGGHESGGMSRTPMPNFRVPWVYRGEEMLGLANGEGGDGWNRAKCIQV